MSQQTGQTWSPWDLIFHNTGNYAVIVLNTPLNFDVDKSFLLDIWNKAKLRLTVDGGTDRWIQWLGMNNISPALASQPELITGDMDSISKSLLTFYEKSEHTKVVKTEDQSKTDFTKALIQVSKFSAKNGVKVEDVLVLSEVSGRFDQLLSIINTMQMSRKLLPETNVFMLCPNSLTWVLFEGEHRIVIPKILRVKEEHCALIPMGHVCRISTNGLKWDLKDFRMKFGEFISTSNTYNGSEVVTVETDQAVVWTMGLNVNELYVSRLKYQ